MIELGEWEGGGINIGPTVLIYIPYIWGPYMYNSRNILRLLKY